MGKKMGAENALRHDIPVQIQGETIWDFFELSK